MLDEPLRVDWIQPAELRDDLPGRLGMTFLPGKRGPSLRYPGRVYRRELAADLDALLAQRVRGLLLLVEDAELERWGDRDIAAHAARAGIDLHRWPIPDGAPPGSLREIGEILAWIRDTRRSGNVAVACMGGVGRTGTIAACALVDVGWSPAEAIDLVRRLRHPTAVETDAQVAFVRAFALHRAGGAVASK